LPIKSRWIPFYGGDKDDSSKEEEEKKGRRKGKREKEPRRSNDECAFIGSRLSRAVLACAVAERKNTGSWRERTEVGEREATRGNLGEDNRKV